MKYDPIELMKLNITESDIQKQRDRVLEALTKQHAANKIVMIYEKVWLPFIVDMFDDYETLFEPDPFGVRITVIINLNP